LYNNTDLPLEINQFGTNRVHPLVVGIGEKLPFYWADYKKPKLIQIGLHNYVNPH